MPPPKKHDRNRKNNSRKKPNRSFSQNPRPAKPAKPGPVHEKPEVEGMRLNKYVAHSGICSRRQAADHVKNGLVTVNGEVERSPGYQVQEGDEIRFKGELIQPEERKVYLLLNKPRGYITTTSDDRGRKTVLDLVSDKVPERIFPVGRLDRETTGLLLLTNDGDLAKKLAHPSHEIKKFYQVTLDKNVTPEHIEAIRQGLELEDGPTPVDGVDYLRGGKKNEVGIEIHIGRNRIVRRIFEHLGYEVKRLDRSYYAGLTKKDLPRGFSRHLTEREIIMLKHFI
ncbi:pseudouridine synthase [Phaeodactylibacter xiamenensis]|jgi:23S rRNA pseudouridine2605 synthase|uniref:Pseudouridine synthase n=1 Tax=Phaeodactylibacter xiamenensis TaxID=1524460 RepID=A0A098S6G9_9BACT|nr:pseudouridine synthase [Phaeodactylibacter xiamenensis]KGE87735.1 pseudouridine synthase [Phaeodactylibacter xiamenensis]MCR9052080.1 rRNA pseudouridine synthase [bacterium]